MILVDDSASVRTLLGQKLGAAGYDVEDFPDAVAAAERALVAPPAALVTDLLMPGMSGVQLCRFLQHDPATANVPVVLLTAAGDRRSRFWARSAGAVAFVSKAEVDALIELLPKVMRAAATAPPVSGAVTSRGMVQERLSQILDGALFDSVIAGEVRMLASAGDAQRVFADLAALASEVLTYRWLALALEGETRSLMVHLHGRRRDESEHEARMSLGVAPEKPAFVVADERAVAVDGPAPLLIPIFFGTIKLGDIAFAFTSRGIAREDRKLAALIAHELGGPLRMATLVEETRRLAAIDSLTGLLNRRAFLDAITRERSRAERHALPISILMIDVDHFKQINDMHGHSAGDLVLKRIAQVLASIARKSDFVARWGGEEFVLALPQTSEAGARVAAERVRRAIADASQEVAPGTTVKVTASIGLASAGSPWQLDDMIARADQAMYAAKGRGRNRVELSKPSTP